MKRKTWQAFVICSTGMVIVRLVKVKAYKRLRNGKTERVRSHYRSI